MPKIDYKNADGKSLSGVTTIIGNNLAWNKGALLGWAYNRGKEGKPLRDQDALDIGTFAHKWIESDIKGMEFPWPELDPKLKGKIENSFLAYLEWKEQVHFKLIQSELSLVSELHQFGGTIDVIGEVNGHLAIIDLKTSDEIYVDHRIQVAAYKNLYNENFLDAPITMVYILKLGKRDGGFSYHYFPDLELEWGCFLTLLKMEGYRQLLK